MQQIISSLVFRCITYLYFLGVMCTTAHAQTIKYQYDALGRVTFVEDPTNGNRDYDYDKAGNRLFVAASTSTDSAAEPTSAPAPTGPAVPTGLLCSSVGPGAWQGSWNPVTDASYYVYRTTSEESGNEVSVSGTSIVKNASCKWVKACNSANLCSAKANF